MVALNETGGQMLGVVNEFCGGWKHSLIIALRCALADALFQHLRLCTRSAIETEAMIRLLALLASILVFAAPALTAALALDLPTRKAGVWELKMIFEGRNLPDQVMKQCVDAATDKLMSANFGGSNE